MKLILTEKRKAANKANQRLAANAWKQKCQIVREQKSLTIHKIHLIVTIAVVYYHSKKETTSFVP